MQGYNTYNIPILDKRYSFVTAFTVPDISI